MCGIFGKRYFKQHPREKSTLLDCLEVLSHRGPDDTGYYEGENIFLGSKRLSIIDLSKDGHMPMANEDGRLHIVFNGEIYNYRELKHSMQKNHRFRSNTDTEVVLHMYEQYGPACLNKLRGMFAFAIWDNQKNELFLARDQIGKKPLKYYFDGKIFVFASELKAILKDPAVPREMDEAAIDQFLTYQYVPSPRTGFRNIHKLEPAHYMVVRQNGAVRTHCYWQPTFLPKSEASSADLELETLKRLRDAVKIRLRSDVPLGAHLSGGIDSSLIVALMAEEMDKPVETFSVGFAEPGYNELPFARLVARKYKTNHHELLATPALITDLPDMVYHYEEPYADPSLLPTWALSKETRKSVTVALNGDGGDENFAGYLRYKVFMACRLLRHMPFLHSMGNLTSQLYKMTGATSFRHAAKVLDYAGKYNDVELYAKLVGCMDTSEKNGLYTADFKKAIMSDSAHGYLAERLGNGKLSPLDRLLYTDIETYLGEDLMTKVDIAGMAHSLEIRSPFLDQHFMDFTSTLPDRLKLNGLTGKYLLRKVAKQYVPAACINREKQGFGIPLRIWMDDQWRPHVKSLLEKKFLSYGIVRKDRIRELLQDTDSSYNSLWTLLILKEWLSVWF